MGLTEKANRRLLGLSYASAANTGGVAHPSELFAERVGKHEPQQSRT